MSKYSLSALVAAGLLAGGMSVSSASAADLGGNCCADLEERIAELEATTARKGNRKVSLTVSGWVAEQVMWWDDGHESNVYVGGIGATLGSHVKFTGEAAIVPGWSAGYVLHLEANTSEPYAGSGWNQNQDGRGAAGVSVLQSYWFLKSDQLGKVGVGRQSQASDNTAILVDGSGSLVPANWVLFDNSDFFLRAGGVQFDGSAAFPGTIFGFNGNAPTLTWGSIGFCQHISLGIGGDCDGVPNNVVRYDSPSFGGFSVSASWGEDDLWDVAARYAGEVHDFKIAAAAAYSENSDENLNANPGITHRDSRFFQVGAYVEHIPTGLFAYGAYGNEQNDNTYAPPVGFYGTNTNTGEVYYLKGGIRQRWTPLGHTVLYGEYSERINMFDPTAFENPGSLFGADPSTLHSNMQEIGGGLVQEVDAAAMSLWISYKHFDGDVSGCGKFGGPCGSIDFDSFDLVKFGALINF
jgi:predicted porin